MKKNYIFHTLILLLLISCSEGVENNEITVQNEDVSYDTLFVGTYTKKEGHVDGKAAGIYIMKMNSLTGELEEISIVKNTVNPSYLAIHPNKKYLYAVNEIADGNQIGKIKVYKYADGKATEIQELPTFGDAPCHVSISQNGDYLFVANYMEYIASYIINENGTLEQPSSVIKHTREKPAEFRQETGHPHMVLPAFEGNELYVSDLGTDEITHYQIEDGGMLTVLTKTSTAFKAGPRHMVAHPSKPYLFVLNELNSTVESYERSQADEPMKRIATISTLNEPDENVGPSAIKIHPNGKFLYAANRGIHGGTENSITVFTVGETGELSRIQIQDSKGLVPRDFEISPNGQFLLAANQNSNSIVTFKINQNTGILEETDIVKEVMTPVCLKFL